MSGPADASRRLQHALVRDARARGILLSIERTQWTSWASVTFSGARHSLALSLTAGEDASRWLGDLGECELALAGHLVADLVVSEGSRSGDRLCVTVEALTVES